MMSGATHHRPETAREQVHRQGLVFGLGALVGVALSAVYCVVAVIVLQITGGLTRILDTDPDGHTLSPILSVSFALIFGIPYGAVLSGVLGGMTSLGIGEIFRMFPGRLSPSSAALTGGAIPSFVAALINGAYFFYAGPTALSHLCLVFLFIPSLIYVCAGGWGGRFLYLKTYQSSEVE